MVAHEANFSQSGLTCCDARDFVSDGYEGVLRGVLNLPEGAPPMPRFATMKSLPRAVGMLTVALGVLPLVDSTTHSDQHGQCGGQASQV